jgi:ketosteroid isomerase-like protein
MTNLEIVKQGYENFKKGNVPGLLGVFDPGIEFRLAEGHPYRMDGKPWHGGQEITQNFFVKGTEWQDWNFIIDQAIEADGAVIVEGRYAGLYKPTGRTMDVQVCHIWRLRDGKITSFHQYLDTARLQQVMGHESAPR